MISGTCEDRGIGGLFDTSLANVVDGDVRFEEKVVWVIGCVRVGVETDFNTAV